MKKAIRAYSIFTVALFVAATAAFSQAIQPQQPYCGTLWHSQRIFDDNAPDPQDVGKYVVTGSLKKIEHSRLTIYRQDGVEQLLSVDASTQFFSDYGCTATLVEFKIGDQVYAIGTVEDGDFVATKVLKTPASPNAPVRMPCTCASGINAQARSLGDSELNDVGRQSYLWQVWMKAYDVGHELPLNSQIPH